MARRLMLMVAAIVLAAGGVPAAEAAERLAGPVPARLVSVLDGDTVEVAARIWLGQSLRVRVRLAGIDAPELHGRCNRERTLARRARDRLAALLGSGDVTLTEIRNGKYAGRVVANLAASNGIDAGTLLLASGLAHRYDGRARLPWCSTAER